MRYLAEISKEEFERLKIAAEKSLRDISSKQQTRPPFPDFVRVPPSREERSKTEESKAQPEPLSRPLHLQKKPEGRASSFLRHINLPEMLKDKDSLLILGLILLLSNEEADDSLIMALAYILL